MSRSARLENLIRRTTPMRFEFLLTVCFSPVWIVKRFGQTHTEVFSRLDA
jgi:hypothetical protein